MTDLRHPMHRAKMKTAAARKKLAEMGRKGRSNREANLRAKATMERLLGHAVNYAEKDMDT